jgi:S-(hydroxymethyl)glutathione dehydrogenase/alcohol dehydrogenase
MITNAMILTSLNNELEYRAIELQEIKDHDVLVKILFSGVCHTQLLEARGKRGMDNFLPHCMGHEASGIVEKVGKKVTTVSLGDKVALTWIQCNGGNSGGKKHIDIKTNKVINAGPVATFSHYAVVSENRCITVSKNLDDQVTAILGCALATGYGLVNRTSLVKPQEKVALVGAGGIGQSALIFLKLLGVSNITIFDINDLALERAEKIVKSDLVNSKDFNEKNHSDAFDCVIETSGSKSGSELAYELANRYNGRVIFAGNLSHGTKILIDPFHLLQGKKVIGCGYQNSNPNLDFNIIEKYILDYPKLFEKLISDVLPLNNLNEAFDLMEKGKVLRVILDCSK